MISLHYQPRFRGAAAMTPMKFSPPSFRTGMDGREDHPVASRVGGPSAAERIQVLSASWIGTAPRWGEALQLSIGCSTSIAQGGARRSHF